MNYKITGNICSGIVIMTMAAILFCSSIAQQSKAQGPASKAPQWEISEWINSPGLNIDQLKGKIVVIDFFQLWCPGCNKFTIPLIARWEKKFADETKAGRIVFVSIHTVFEGHDYQNPDRLRKYVKRKQIHHPVGIDRHIGGDRVPATMRRYKTRGTPEIAVVDKNGFIRFQKFGYFAPEFGEDLILTLLGEAPSGSAY